MIGSDTFIHTFSIYLDLSRKQAESVKSPVLASSAQSDCEFPGHRMKIG